jgi:hypothetical protein
MGCIVPVLMVLSLPMASAPHGRRELTNEGIKIGVGFRWQNWNYYVEIYDVDGVNYYFQSVKNKNRDFMGSPVSHDDLLKVLKNCPQPRSRYKP